MKHILFHAFCMLCTFFFPKLSIANSDIIITGQVKGCRNDSISLGICYKNTKEQADTRFLGVTNENGTFCFVVPSNGLPIQKTFFLSVRKHGELFGLISKEYICEPGDRINVFATKSGDGFTCKFEGKGSDKWKLQDQLDLLLDRFNTLLEKFTSPILKSNLIQTSTNEYLFKARTIINNYRYKISPFALSLFQSGILIELFGNPHISTLSDKFTSLNKFDRKITFSIYQQMCRINNTYPYQTADQSEYYILFQMYKTRFKLVLNAKGKQVSMSDVYDEEKKDTGFLRDMTLIRILKNIDATGTTPTDSIHALRLWEDAYDEVETPDLRNYVAKKKSFRLRGAKIEDFEMEDLSGKMVHLSDFKGKVIIIDLWFTGCTSCARLHRMMEDEVLPAINNNPDFVSINICIDRDKEQWKRSVATNIYTNTKYVNLFSGGLGAEHPFLKYYEFRGGSGGALLLSKNWNIFSGSIPPHNGSELIRFISDALNERKN